MVDGKGQGNGWDGHWVSVLHSLRAARTLLWCFFESSMIPVSFLNCGYDFSLNLHLTGFSL